MVINGTIIKQHQFEHVSSTVTKICKTDEDIQQRLKTAKGAFVQLRCI